MKITFVQTGGTIDEEYPRGVTNHGYNFEIGDPAFSRILAKVKPMFDRVSISALLKDSLDITDPERQLVCDVISFLESDKVVVTHGTETIHRTAQKLGELSGKTIVLTGATLPERFSDSDAMFNLGMAVAAVQILPHGVYIALNGEVAPWDKFQLR